MSLIATELAKADWSTIKFSARLFWQTPGGRAITIGTEIAGLTYLLAKPNDGVPEASSSRSSHAGKLPKSTEVKVHDED